MNKKKLLTLIGCLALVGMIGVGATLAYMTDNDTAKNVITMGHVDIDLTEPNYKPTTPTENGGEITNVKPGDTIAKDPTITVGANSEDTYLRVKLDVDIVGLGAKKGVTKEAYIQEIIKSMNIDSNDWELKGDYYYYIGILNNNDPGVLKANDTVKLFEEVKIPAEWGNEIADAKINIDVKAEAVQVANFNLNDDGTWPQVEIEKYSK